MSRFIDIEEISKSAGVNLPPQIAQTGFYNIKSLPMGKPNTLLSGFSGLMKPIVVLLMIEDGNHWKYYDNELISLPAIAELNRANIGYYVTQKLPDCRFTILGYLPIADLMAKAPKLDTLSTLNLEAELPLPQENIAGLSWIQVQSEHDPHPQIYVANLVVSICHKDKTYSVNGVVYKGSQEIRMSSIKAQQANGVPILYMPILKEHLL